MGKLLLLAASGVVGALVSLAGADVVSGAPTTGAHVAQYSPNVPSTEPTDVSNITTAPPHGADDATTKADALPTTGADSVRLAGAGLALVVAGIGIVVVRRHHADQPQPARG